MQNNQSIAAEDRANSYAAQHLNRLAITQGLSPKSANGEALRMVLYTAYLDGFTDHQKLTKATDETDTGKTES